MKIIQPITTSLAVAALVLGASSVSAQAADAGQMSDMKPSVGTSAPSGGEMTQGEVRKVDADTKKITLKHGPIANLGMPGMTMVFQLKDPSMIEKVKAGDQVKFTADRINGAITITSIEAAK